MTKAIKKGPGRPQSSPRVPATEGQRLLVASKGGVASIAKRLGLPMQRVDDWRAGRSKPNSANARKVAEVLGIPVEAWTRKPGADLSPPSPAPAPTPAPTGPKPTTLEEIESLLADLRHMPADLTAPERKRRMSERMQLLGLKARIERHEALTTEAIVRAHPHWRRIREALREALAPYPEALKAVHDRLAAIGEWETEVEKLKAEADSEEPSE